MSGSRHDWLDDETAERLLRGEPADAGNTGNAAFDSEESRKLHSRRLDALTDLLHAASTAADVVIEPDREETALAAFRAARSGPAAIADPDPADGGRTVVPAGRMSRLRARRGSAKVALAAVVAATALASGVAAAAVGVIPSPFTGLDPAPHTGPHRPTGSTEAPQLPEPAGSASKAPDHGTASGPATAPPHSPTPGPGAAPGHRGSSLLGSGGHHGPDPADLCRAYVAAESGHGGVQPDVLRWLTGEAGTGTSVDSYCHKHYGTKASPPTAATGKSVITNGAFDPGECQPSGGRTPGAGTPGTGTTGAGTPGAGAAAPAATASPAPAATASPAPSPTAGAASGQSGAAGPAGPAPAGSGTPGPGVKKPAPKATVPKNPGHPGCRAGAAGDDGPGGHSGDRGPGHGRGSGGPRVPLVPYAAKLIAPSVGPRPLSSIDLA